MERYGATPSSSASSSSNPFVNWEEFYVSSDRGRREIHYYLKKRDGISDLALIGRERSHRHMFYDYNIKNRSLVSVLPSQKLKSRREVIDWLNSIVSEASRHGSSQSAGASRGLKDVNKSNTQAVKDNHLWKLGHSTKEFVWLGSSWTCRKRRKHYESFQRNGTKISVHDFVFVLAEEDKRLVAYLEDLYEDSRGNRMVVVQWFHRIDEVGITLPHKYNDREIFFSLCLQDLSIECINGLATVLSPQHYEKFVKEAAHTQLEPFVCDRLFDCDEVKPFNLTQVKGYWKQEILRYMYTSSPSRDAAKSQMSETTLKVEDTDNDGFEFRPTKRHRWSKDGDVRVNSSNEKEPTNIVDVEVRVCSVKEGCSPASLSGKEAISPLQLLALGSQVEILSQDSGMIGCWLRASVIKRSKDKEWVMRSRIALPDDLGLRTSGRTTIRPARDSNNHKDSRIVGIGSIVDAWWFDGWWEGIVIKIETDDRYHVFFPGEKRESIFSRGDLRHSQEWLGNKWMPIKERADAVSLILSGRSTNQVEGECCRTDVAGSSVYGASVCEGTEKVTDIQESLAFKNASGCSISRSDSGDDKARGSKTVPDLLNDDRLAKLKWKSRKRRHGNSSSAEKPSRSGESGEIFPEVESHSFEGFVIPKSLKVDHENCKYVGDSLFGGSSVVPPLTNLVMSR
ncbi:Agenet-like domain [Dillenia turbinata]|uniref:Agenet-like domain n=1 Tax=Dillenia turbinata TaxID=194707 RepID=A0AAN8ZF34_9MAGN